MNDRYQPPAPQDGGGSAYVGSMSGGAFTTGAGSHITYDAGQSAVAPADEQTRVLLEAVRTLRQQLAVLAESEDTRQAGAELDAVEADITGTGRAEPERLSRLRTRLTDGASAVGALAGVTAVVQAVSQILG